MKRRKTPPPTFRDTSGREDRGAQSFRSNRDHWNAVSLPAGVPTVLGLAPIAVVPSAPSAGVSQQVANLNDKSEFNCARTKVRKPYTITKERERWTETEHARFLEGLKLYGRQWRKIEEHIGTKTAVQIRSHAQKFFSKLEREAVNGGGKNKQIAIPPPRPKRKPVHPYPRKADASQPAGGTVNIGEQSEHNVLGKIDMAAKAAAAATTAMLGARDFNPSGGFVVNPSHFLSVPGVIQWPTLAFGNGLPGLFPMFGQATSNSSAVLDGPSSSHANISPNIWNGQSHTNSGGINAVTCSSLEGTNCIASKEAGTTAQPSQLGDQIPIQRPQEGINCTFQDKLPTYLGFDAQQSLFKSSFERWFGSTFPLLVSPNHQQAFTAAAVAAANAYAYKFGENSTEDMPTCDVEAHATYAATMAAAMVASQGQEMQSPSQEHAKRRAERAWRLRQQKARRYASQRNPCTPKSALGSCLSCKSGDIRSQRSKTRNNSRVDPLNGGSDSGGHTRDVSPQGDSGTTNEGRPKSPSPQEALKNNRYSSHGSGSLTAVDTSNCNCSGSGSDGNDGNQDNSFRLWHGLSRSKTTPWDSQKEGNAVGSGSEGDEIHASNPGRGSSDKSSIAGSGSEEEMLE